MKILKKISVLLFMIPFSVTINAQELEHHAPTLQVGLDGINFSKGSLDPEIIARIIAAKQNEIKIKIIQNSFLNNIYGSGGTIYNYADNIIKGVVQEADVDVRTRKIMESTVNLVFVHAFADFYLKNITEDATIKKDSTKLKNVQNLAAGYELEFLKSFKNGLKYRKLLDENFKYKKKCSCYNINDERFNKKLNGNEIEDKNDNLNQFIALIIDISSEVIKNNEILRDLGLMRISYSTNYDYLNLYKQQQNYSLFGKRKIKPKNPLKKVKSIGNSLFKPENKEKSKKVYENMKKILEKYTSYIGALRFINESKNFKSNSISLKFNLTNNDRNPQGTHSFSKINIQKIIEQLTEEFKSVSKNKYVKENYLKDLETAIVKLNASLNYINKAEDYLLNKEIDKDDRLLMISDMLYSLKMEVIPNIEYSIKFAPELINTRDAVTDLSKEIYTQLISQVKFLENLTNDTEPFINLVSKLYEFDKSKTFSEYISLITLLDEIFQTGKFKTALSTINTFVKDYTKITTDELGNETLFFNIESFLVKLDRLQSDKIRRFQFHFTVGMNTTFFLNREIDLGDGQQIGNFSHFSEKIGLKFLLINKGDWLPKSPGESYGSFGFEYVKTSPPKEPLISNVHLLLYGSGILYNVINSSTNKEFNYPMVGLGTGVTFYNALDFNVSVGMPLLEKGGFNEMKNNLFLNFGFDFQITEYLKEVGKKRRERKLTEQLTSKK